MTEKKEITKAEKVTALHKFSKDVMEVWNNTDRIKEVFAPTLTATEFKFFCGLGISLGANPFKREIWAVKYDKSKPAAIFCGRDFYRRKAQEQPDYLGHIAEAVYENDEYSVVDGKPEHKFTLKDRGDMIGAYFVGYRKNMVRCFYHFVKFSEYNKQQSLWKTHPESQIKKVAESQGLRMMFQGVFAGTYDESEIFDADVETDDILGDPIEMPKKIEILDPVEPSQDPELPLDDEVSGDADAAPPKDYK